MPYFKPVFYNGVGEPETFGQLLYCQRGVMGWTAAEAARKLGVSRQLFSAYETGRKIPGFKTALRIIAELGVLPECGVLLVINDLLRQYDIPMAIPVRETLSNMLVGKPKT